MREGRLKDGYSSLSPPLESLVHELALAGRVDAPETALAGFLLRPRHLHEVPVQGQVVTDRVLGSRGQKMVSKSIEGYKVGRGSYTAKQELY